jgi:hypothetical protein
MWKIILIRNCLLKQAQTYSQKSRPPLHFNRTSLNFDRCFIFIQKFPKKDFYLNFSFLIFFQKIAKISTKINQKRMIFQQAKEILTNPEKLKLFMRKNKKEVLYWVTIFQNSSMLLFFSLFRAFSSL